jgi:Asp-tRNA(Asn)/Glu-tRNA(Gln) amidotransferase B subunit
MSLHLAKPEHEVAYQDLCALVNKHAAKLSAIELLAVASNMLGKLVALQDQRTISPAMAMEVVAQNIEHGNKMVLDQLMQSKGRA